MFKTKIRIQDRILAMLLAVAMLFTTMPSNIYAGVNGYEDEYTIQVLDGESNPLEDAMVVYTITGESIEGLVNVEGTTNQDGVVAIDLVTDYSEIISESTPVTLSYTVEKDGYITGEKANVTITDATGTDQIILAAEVSQVENYTVVANVNEGGTVKLNGAEESTLENIVKDSIVKVTVTPAENYVIQSIEIGGVFETIIDERAEFEKDITITANTEVNVTFVSALYKFVISDGDTPIEGATIKYNFSKKLAENSYETIVSNEEGIVTGADGTIVVDLSAYADVIRDGEVVLTYTVAKEGYMTAEVTDECPIFVTAYNAETSILLLNLFTVSVTTNETDLETYVEAGTITLDGTNVSELMVEDGTEVELVINAAEYENCSYRISSVQINGVEALEVGNVSTFTKKITVDAAKTIVVEYVRVYTITITGTDNENGTITTDPAHTDGVVVVEETKDGKFKISAAPDSNYRVSSVKINSVEDSDEVTKIKGNNDESYEKVLPADRNYIIEVAFALNRYSVLAEIAEDQKGTIEFDENVSDGFINHNGSTTVIVTPESGYSVSEIIVQDITAGDVPIDIFTHENGVVTFTLSNVTEDKKITATFVATEKVSADYVVFEAIADSVLVTPIRKDNGTYVYQKNAEVTIKVSDVNTENNNIDILGIRVYELVDGREVLIESDNPLELILTETTSISKVEVYYQADNELCLNWHVVDGLSIGKVVIDKELSADDILLVFSDKPTKHYYNESFNVNIMANDTGDYSGIAEVSYWTEINENISQAETVIYPTTEETEIKDSVTVDALIEVSEEINNSEAVVVKVMVTDRAGNSVIKTAEPVRVNFTPPELVSIEVTGEQNAEAKDGYYTKRTARIRIKDREESFNPTNAKNGIEIEVVDTANIVPIPAMIGEWQHVEGSEGIYETTIIFTADARYNWSFDYTNEAGKELITTDATTITGDKVYEFVVDNTKPTAEIKTEETVWSELLTLLTFGIWKNNDVTVTADATDVTAGVNTILYYKTVDVDSLLTETELNALYGNNNEFNKFTEDEYIISAKDSSEKFVVYARIADNAGNYKYICTDGIIVEDLEGSISFAGTDSANIHGFYNSDVNVAISVSENKNASSGIQKIEYKVYKDVEVDKEGQFVKGELTKQETLFSFNFVKNEEAINQIGTLTILDKSKEQETTVTNNCELTYDKLAKEWNGKITVDGVVNNSDHVMVLVTVTDNAGNTYENSMMLAINTDDVKAEISFEPTEKTDPKNNAPNMVVEVEGEVDKRGYFSLAERVATITITDRESAFYEENADEGIDIFATDADKKEIELTEGVDYVISEWRHSKDKETGEDKHTATVTFKTNANYTWSFNYTNKASNSLEVGEEGNLSTGDSETPFTFTVDDEDPTGSISLNENFWFELLELITFGLYSNDKVDMRATYEDEISPVIVEYYKTDDTVALKEEDLEKLREKGEFEPYDEENDVFPIEAENSNERLVVYLRIADYAGNVTYISSDGFVLDNTLCEITLTPVMTTDPVQPINNIYSQDVTIDVAINDAVNDDKSHSGIKNIAYKIYKDATVESGKVISGTVTAQDILYSFDFVKNEGAVNQIGTLTVIDQSKGTAEPVIKNNVELTYEELTASWEGKIIVDAEDNNSCDVVVEVTVVDNAGNEVTQLLKLDIDITHPTIEVSFDNNEDNNGNGYFTDTRKATVVITERTNHFNRTKATEAIKITAVDALGKPVSDAYKIPEIEDWVSVEGVTADAATHTATIVFEKDANYTWEIAYTDDDIYAGDAAYVDEAGNANLEPVDTGDSVAPFKFTIDRVAPNGVITATAEGIDKDEQKVTRTEDWDELREEDFRFGFWSNGSIKLTGTYTDATSVEMAKVEYFKEVIAKGESKNETPKKEEELDAITTWSAFDDLKVEEDEQFVIYLKITDPAGNYSYICTNGLIIDHEKPIEETIAPEITTTPVKQPLNDIYREDVTVAVKVVEPEKGDTYSGLKRVGYKVFNMGNETQNDELEKLFIFEVENPTQDELQNLWEDEAAFVVEAKKNNSNDVKIVVFAEDNAGNYSEDEVSIKIDITAPTIQVIYNNNVPDNGRYFDADRTATITITERNFKAEDVKITITNTDGTVPGNPKWSKTDGSGNGDNTKWTGTITYSADGDYKFDITYTDLAGLKASAPQYGDSVVPTEFTIDKTLPVVSVSYDNNNVANDKYFNAPRTAEVKIIEHNFDVSRVQFDFDVNGAGGSQPTVSWREDGDTHTAVLSYELDGDYTFDVIIVQDMAGNNFETVNYGDSVAAQEFTVDTEIEDPVIGGIDPEDNAYGYDEEIIPTVTVEDINYDRSEVRLYRTSRADINVDVTEQYIGQIDGGVSGGNKEYPIFGKDEAGKYNREMEGFYRMTATVWDKAGNESETAEAEFFINRFGSVYIYDEEYLVPLIGTYVQEVEKDLVIMEFNATEVDVNSVRVEITRDGKPVENIIVTEPKSFTPSTEEGRGWYEYHHTIGKENFMEEGTYKVSVSSKDEANNISENTNYEDMGIMFYVDKEAPEITRYNGFETAILNGDSAIVDATELKIEYSVYDAIGLKSIKVIVDKEQVGETITDFGDDINNYSGSIVLNESKKTRSVQFIVEDLSGRVTNTDSDEFKIKFNEDFQKDFVSSVTVTTNDWVRFYANKPLFWGTIGGGSATVAAIGAAIAFFRKRKLKTASK